MHSTARGGPSFWPSAGPPHRRTCYRKSPPPSPSSRWDRSTLSDVHCATCIECAPGLSGLVPLCPRRSCTGVYQMILGFWGLWKTLFRILRKSSNLSTFPSCCTLNVLCGSDIYYSLFLCLSSHLIFSSSEEAKSMKKVFSDHCFQPYSIVHFTHCRDDVDCTLFCVILQKTLIRQFSNGEERLQKKQPIRNHDDSKLVCVCIFLII